MSVTDNCCENDVKTLENTARSRLQKAALDLFADRGYDHTTAAQIAAHAGVTERTFFRHFQDKREVLFDGEAVLRAALTTAIADAPNGLPPLDLVFLAFRSVVPLLEANRPFAEPRQAVIVATPALAERELTKHAVLADALAEALVLRGVDDLAAMLAARTGMMAFAHAAVTWLADPTLDLNTRLDRTQASLTTLLRHNAD